ESSCTICRSPRSSLEDFEQLHCLPDPIPGDDLHYKSFEEVYGIRTTENHRLSFAKSSAKTKVSKAKTKHTMPFSPSAARAKNVGVTVNCIECEKPRLLFSAKKLSEKDKALLKRFLDPIFYTCGMSFHDTCDLAMTALPKESEVDDDAENIVEESDTHGEDSISELFSRVFVNDSLFCSATIEKPYYSAGIYPAVCIKYGCCDVNKPTKNEHPHCSDYGSNSINLRKSSIKAKANKKRKHFKMDREEAFILHYIYRVYYGMKILEFEM
ncbi:37222_t:CDS:2, partial [Gigaspora margarita]